MDKSFHRPRAPWPLLVSALAYGLLEWSALTRSRVLDRLKGRARQIAR